MPTLTCIINCTAAQGIIHFLVLRCCCKRTDSSESFTHHTSLTSCLFLFLLHTAEVSKKKDKKAKVKKKLKQKLQQKQERQAQVVKYKDDNVNSEESVLESHSVQ